MNKEQIEIYDALSAVIRMLREDTPCDRLLFSALCKMRHDVADLSRQEPEVNPFYLQEKVCDSSRVYRDLASKIPERMARPSEYIKNPVCPSRYTHVIENEALKARQCGMYATYVGCDWAKEADKTVILESKLESEAHPNMKQYKRCKGQEKFQLLAEGWTEMPRAEPFDEHPHIDLRTPEDPLGQLDYTDNGFKADSCSIEDAPPGEPGTLRADEGFANAMAVGNRRANTDFKWKGY